MSYLVPYIVEDFAKKIENGLIFGICDTIREMAVDYTKRRNVGFGIKSSAKGAFEETGSYVSFRLYNTTHIPYTPGIIIVDKK